MIRILFSTLILALSLHATDVDEALKIAKALDLANTVVVEKAQPAVVFITTEFIDEEYDEDPFSDDLFSRFFGMPRTPKKRSFFSQPPVQKGQGSGFFVSEDGYLLTNYHVVKDATKISVDLSDQDHTSYVAELVGGDPQTDVALLKVNGCNLPYLELQDSDQVRVGQRAIAVGNPFDLVSSVTVGTVSAKGRNNLEIHDLEDFLQTDAAIYPGNSGGPLLDLDGKVIGMNTAMLTNRGNYLGIGFAIPSRILSLIQEQILENGSITRGYIGVMLQNVDKQMAEAMHLDRTFGAIVTQVYDNSPAQKAGLQQGDVLLEINDKTMEGLEMARSTIKLLPQGKTAMIKANRRGKEILLEVEIGHDAPPPTLMGDVARKLGLSVQTLTPELAAEYGYKEGESGVIVTDVRPGSVSSLAHMKKGMIINNVNHEPIKDSEAFNDQLEKTNGKNVFMLVNENGQHVFITLSTNS